MNYAIYPVNLLGNLTDSTADHRKHIIYTFFYIRTSKNQVELKMFLVFFRGFKLDI